MPAEIHRREPEDWWYADHVRAAIMVVMPVFFLIFPPICRTPLALAYCVHASLAIIGLVPAVRLLLFAERSRLFKGLALVFTALNGCIFTVSVWNLLGLI